MTSKSDLVDAFDRFRNGLDWLETQPGDGKARAQELRSHMCTHLTQVTDSMAGKAKRCETHPTERAHNCAPCRSEKIAVREYPDVDPEAQRVSARIVGERPEEGS